MTLLLIYISTVVTCLAGLYLVIKDMSKYGRTCITIQDVIALACLCFLPMFNVIGLGFMGIMHLMEKYNHILKQDAEILFKRKYKQK